MTTTAALQLNSLAALKRAVHEGTEIEVLDSGAAWIKPGEIRTIEVVQKNAIAWRGVWANGGKEWKPDTLGWLYWPKAAELSFYGDDRFTIDFGSHRSTYRVLA